MGISTLVSIGMESLGVEEDTNGNLELSMKENLRTGISMERADGRKSK